MTTQLQVIGIGNAIVDILAHADDAFLADHHIEKGTMRLIEGQEAMAIAQSITPERQMSGGSAANTIAALAQLGAEVGFIGVLGADDAGNDFREDMQRLGVHYDTPPVEDDVASGRCLVFVSPDGERSMATFLGASQRLSPGHISAETVRSADITYLEGYLFDPPPAQAAFYHAAELAHAANKQVALSLSDRFCVERHRSAFKQLLDQHIDILFGNEGEICAVYETDQVEQAAQRAAEKVALVAVTLGAQGSYLIHDQNAYKIPAEPIDQLVDATGAGDLYAAGFLRAYGLKKSPTDCARLGSLIASDILGQLGARSSRDLIGLAKSHGLL